MAMNWMATEAVIGMATLIPPQPELGVQRIKLFFDVSSGA